MTRLYLAGPMTGRPQFNFPAFIEATRLLREAGYDIIAPQERDTPEMQAAAMASPDGNLAALERRTGETWGDVLARDVKTIADEAQGIVLLPMWWTSRGARLEAFVAVLCGHPAYLYNGPDRKHLLHAVSPEYVREMLVAA